MRGVFIGRRSFSITRIAEFFGIRGPARAAQERRRAFLPVVEDLESRITPNAAPGVTNAVVGLDYQTFLARNGSLGEIGGWVNSGLTARQIALDFADSVEYRSDVVNQLFQYYLQTAPTQAQLNTALATLAAAGGSFAQVTAQQIVTSQAYYNLHGPSNSAYVTGPVPGCSEPSAECRRGQWLAWRSQLTNDVGPLAVADDFLASTEYRDDLINRMFEGLVNRLPKATEMAAA